MGEGSSTRRTFLGSLASVGAAAAASETASAQTNYELNDPSVVREIERLFSDYDDALRSNDLQTLNGFFLDSTTTVRFGVRENLYGRSAIEAYRASRATPPNVVRERIEITTYGTDVATVAAAGQVNRTMQTWVRFPQGWRIVAAHVSVMNN